jgi:hypothetical protein
MLQRAFPQHLGDWATRVEESPTSPETVLQTGAFSVFPGEPWTGRSAAARPLPVRSAPLPIVIGDIAGTALFVAHDATISAGRQLERAEATLGALASQRLTTPLDITLTFNPLPTVSTNELLRHAARVTVLAASAPHSRTDLLGLFGSAIGGLGKYQSILVARALLNTSDQMEVAPDVAALARHLEASEDLHVIAEMCLRLVPEARRVFVTVTHDPEDGTTGLHFQVRTRATIDSVVAAEDRLHDALFDRIPSARRSLFSVGYDFIE